MHFLQINEDRQTMSMSDEQMKTARMFARHIESTIPDAMGVALIFLDCGCIQGGPFNEDGEQIGALTHLGQTIHGEIRICQECMEDGGSQRRVADSGIIFFQPSSIGEEKKAKISRKIFSEKPGDL